MPQNNSNKDHKESRFRNYTMAMQWLVRDRSASLTSNQLLVALFIADRTIGWGKRSETITYRHFLEGIQDRESGVWYAGPLPMTRNTLISAIAHLSDTGIIHVAKSKTLTSYSLNHCWSDEDPNADTQKTMGLAKPKRLQTLQTPEITHLPTPSPENGECGGGAMVAPDRGNDCTGPRQSLPLKKSKGKNGKEKKVFPSGKRAERDPAEDETGCPSLDDTLSAVSERSATSRRKRLAKWNRSTVLAIWNDFEKRYHAGVTHFTTTNVNQLSLLQYGKKWIAANNSSEGWMTYLEWCIANWSLIRDEELAWMSGAPTQPSMPFFVKYSDRFEKAHEEKAVFESLSKMPLREREIERRVRRGVDRTVAEKEVDERNGLAKERERLEAAASRIKSSEIDAYGRQREAEADQRRRDRWVEAKKLTTPAEKGTFDEWQ